MKFRLFALVVLVALIAGIVPFAAAQDAPPDLNCLGLSEADCAIVTAANDNFPNVQSFSDNFAFSASITGADAVMGGMGNMAIDTNVSAEGSGTFAIDHSLMTEEAPYAGVSMSMDVTGQSNGGSAPFSFVIVDGNFYIKDAETGAWKGSAISELASQDDMTMFGMPMGDMMSGDMTQMGDMEHNPMLAGLLQLPGLLTQERLADETIDGANTAVFAYTLDLATLFSSPDVQKAVSDLMTQAMAANSQAGANSQASSAMAQQMMGMFPIILQSTTGSVTFKRWVGVDDQFVHKFELDVNGQIDLFGGAASTSSNVTPIPPIEVKLNLAVNLSNINATTAPVAPEGATIVPANELFPNPEATPAS